MKKYFYVQVKRLLRLIVPVLFVAAILFGCLTAVYDAMTKLEDESQMTTRFKIGVVGTAGEMYLKLGLSALNSMDSSRFSMELVEMEEEAAEEAMRKGTITAYMVIPEGFLDAALNGQIMSLKFVCTAGAVGMVSLVKNEFTQMIEIMLIEAQRGIYGAGDAMESIGLNGSDLVNDISIEYAEFVFCRGNVYKAYQMESFDGLGLDGYLITGISVVLFLLICLTFSPMMIRRDHALGRMLCARGRGVTLQVLCDFGVYVLGLCAVAAVVLGYLVFGMDANVTGNMLLQALPAIFALGAMSFLLYEVVSDLVSGVLLQFFAILVLSFVSGCMYPITFFPETVQKLANFLPTGMARNQVANCMLQSHDFANTAGLLGYGCLFLLVAVLIRRFKTAGVRG